VDYGRYVKSNTAKELAILEKSAEFQRYMRLKKDQNSRFYEENRSYDDLERISLSDDSDGEEVRRKEK
jgi:hypothetical protein